MSNSSSINLSHWLDSTFAFTSALTSTLRNVGYMYLHISLVAAIDTIGSGFLVCIAKISKGLQSHFSRVSKIVGWRNVVVLLSIPLGLPRLVVAYGLAIIYCPVLSRVSQDLSAIL